MSDRITAETITITGSDGDDVEAYLATPDDAPRGGVVVIHHMPGYDAATKAITVRFATLGFVALCPNLHYREAPGASPDDAAAESRARGGVPDERLVGDVGAAADLLRSLGAAKVGVIGYCSGGRQSVLAACALDLDAAVDCYGAFVVGEPPEGFPIPITNIEDRLASLSCPVLGLFGGEDKYPSPEHVERLTDLLGHHGKDFTPITYDDAGHGFFAVDRPSYRVAAANNGWERVEAFFGRHLAPDRTVDRSNRMCTYTTEHIAVEGSAKGVPSWIPVQEATVYFDHPVHAMAEHTLNIDFRAPDRGPSSRVAVELTAASARELVRAIEAALAAVPAGMAA